MRKQQLYLFSVEEMNNLKVVKEQSKKAAAAPDDRELMVMAMADCMKDGNYDGPENAAELCEILGFI